VTEPETATWGPAGGMKMTSPGSSADVAGLVAVEQEVVEIEVGDGDAVALDLDVAQAALGGGAAGGEEGVEQGAERADGVVAGLAGLADDEDLDGAELAEIYVEVEVAIDAGELGAEEVG
jgi:hypothetical protein